MEEVKYKRLVPSALAALGVDMTRTIRISSSFGDAYFRGTNCVSRRGRGEFKDRAIYLPDNYDWVIGVDSTAAICLIPLSKDEEET